MNLIKQDVSVWIKGTDQLPDEEDEIIIRDINGRKRIAFIDSDGFYKFSRTKAPSREMEWLKPIEQVYVFTPDELGRLIKDALLWYDDGEGSIDHSARDFLNSITK